MSNRAVEKKWKAIERFKQKLLSSEFGSYVAKIILFGSVLRNEAQEDSDIDLMIFVANTGQEVRNFLEDLTFDIWWETGERIEKLLYPLSDIRYPRSWLVYRTLSAGKEIYSMEAQEIKKREQQGYIQLAQYFIEAAKELLTKDFFRAAVDLAYNGAELAVKGFLLLKLDDLPSTHGGIVNKFGQLFVKTGEVDPQLGRRLNSALEKRNRARYAYEVDIQKGDAEEVIGLAESLLNLFESKI